MPRLLNVPLFSLNVPVSDTSDSQNLQATHYEKNDDVLKQEAMHVCILFWKSSVMQIQPSKCLIVPISDIFVSISC